MSFNLSMKEQQNLMTTTKYRNDPKFSDRQVWANSVDPDQIARVYTVCLKEQSYLGLHCLPFRLHLLDSLLYA